MIYIHFHFRKTKEYTFFFFCLYTYKVEGMDLTDNSLQHANLD